MTRKLLTTGALLLLSNYSWGVADWYDFLGVPANSSRRSVQSKIAERLADSATDEEERKLLSEALPNFVSDDAKKKYDDRLQRQRYSDEAPQTPEEAERQLRTVLELDSPERITKEKLLGSIRTIDRIEKQRHQSQLPPEGLPLDAARHGKEETTTYRALRNILTKEIRSFPGRQAIA